MFWRGLTGVSGAKSVSLTAQIGDIFGEGLTGVSGAKSVSLTAQIGNAFGENLFKNLTYFIKYVRDIVIIGLSKVGGLIGVDRVDTVDTEYTNNMEASLTRCTMKNREKYRISKISEIQIFKNYLFYKHGISHP